MRVRELGKLHANLFCLLVHHLHELHRTESRILIADVQKLYIPHLHIVGLAQVAHDLGQ